jgi:penicillin-binding protein 2
MYEFQISKDIAKRRIHMKNRIPMEPQDVLLDSLAKKRDGEMGIPDLSPEIPLSRAFLRILLASIILFLLYAAGHAFHFQILQEESFAAQSLANRFRADQGQAERGVLYDKNGEQLVFNRQSFHLTAYPQFFSSQEEERSIHLKIVSELAGVSLQDLEQLLHDSQEEKIYVLRDLDNRALVALQPRIEELPGFDLEISFKRAYVDPLYFSHVVGYTGRISREEFEEHSQWYTPHDSIGKAGIEKHYEHVLRMFPGRVLQERDARGRIIGQTVETDSEPGDSLGLWIDAELQRVSYDFLQSGLRTIGASKGVVVAMDPRTGGVLAMVSIPSYDNMQFQYGTQEEIATLFSDTQSPLLNRAIAGIYPTGSAIKPLIALAALEENTIKEDTQIFADGKIEIPHRYNPEITYTFRDLRSYGWTDVKRAIAQSVNVYFYAIGGGYEDQEGLGPARIKHYLELFGFGERTTVDLPGEGRGLVPSPEWKLEAKNEAWWDGDTYLFSIGQGNFLATPMQLASSFVPIANGGTLYQPQIARQIISSQDGMVQDIVPVVLNEGFFDQNHATIIREGMRDAVAYGSSVHLQELPVSSAAKTGTAQTGRLNIFHNWVVAMAPYEDPEIVLVILIEEVEGLQQAVLPIARNILEWYFTDRLHY